MSFDRHALACSLRLAVALCALAPASIPAQSVGPDSLGTLRGVIVSAAEQHPLGYATVSLEPLGAERFADAQGRFGFAGLPSGAYRVRARQLGFTPSDTVIVLSAAAMHPVIRLTLQRVVVRLAAIRVTGPVKCTAPGRPDPVAASELALIFDQIRQNAERYRLLADAYPVAFRMERRSGEVPYEGTSRVTATDTLLIRSDYRRHYTPGKVITREQGPNGKPEYSVHLPLLADFADSAFLGAHCFTYAGLDSVDGTEYARIDFRASTRLRGPDVEGEMYLDPSSLQLFRTTIRLTRPPTQVRGITALTATSTFIEIIPSVIVVNRVLSTTSVKDRSIVSLTETQMLIDYFFLKRSPLGTPP